jgi:hypothetical protein
LFVESLRDVREANIFIACALGHDPVFERDTGGAAAEFAIFDMLVHSGMKLTVPNPVTSVAAGAAAGLSDDGMAVAMKVVDAEAIPGAANTKAEGGNPPLVAASPAFNA